MKIGERKPVSWEIGFDFVYLILCQTFLINNLTLKHENNDELSVKLVRSLENEIENNIISPHENFTSWKLSLFRIKIKLNLNKSVEV